MQADTPLPYLTADLPGIGGRLKDRPEDFVVEEIGNGLKSSRHRHGYIFATRRY